MFKEETTTLKSPDKTSKPLQVNSPKVIDNLTLLRQVSETLGNYNQNIDIDQIDEQMNISNHEIIDQEKEINVK